MVTGQHYRKSALAILGTAMLTALAASAPAKAQKVEWSKLPRMQLQRQFAGPLTDTIVQRWRDPVDGTICYIYLPITAIHSKPTDSGYVQYGANSIGSVSCTLGPPESKSSAEPAPRKHP